MALLVPAGEHEVKVGEGVGVGADKRVGGSSVGAGWLGAGWLGCVRGGVGKGVCIASCLWWYLNVHDRTNNGNVTVGSRQLRPVLGVFEDGTNVAPFQPMPGVAVSVFATGDTVEKPCLCR